ncbi:MAG TPA: chloride channel protein [Phycisphaerae bacterium]|nr:chloride channel protein [Phycisphaerae bacterium]
MIFWSCLVGFVGGLLAIVYYFLLNGAIHLVWTKLAGLDWLNMPLTSGFYPRVLIITTVGGFFVGLVLKFIGSPGEIAAVVNNIHMERGRIDVRQTPSMVAASLVSITAGGSAGPEAPLVQILGSFGSWVGDRLKLRGDLVRTLTFCGMGTALGAFFGAPLGGALFALEIPHRRGLEYFEALVPSIIAALIGFFVFRSAVGYEGAIYHMAALKELTLGTVAWGVLFGLLGGAVGTLFILLFSLTEHLFRPLHKHTILLATLGGLLIGLIAQIAPVSLFWSELQLPGLLNAAPDYVAHHGVRAAVWLLLFIALSKMIAVGVTLHTGFRGGFIFPLFFIGAAIGLAITLAFPALPAAVVVLCMMAAVNVAVTKTPISTAVILTTLSGTSYMPALVGACFASFLLTTRVSLIRTQRSRASVPSTLATSGS